jgi:lytB protein
VEGTMGEAPDRTTLLESPDDVDRLDLPTDKPLVWLSQTTLSVDETMETVTRLRQKFPLLVSPPTDDICYATQNRQQAVKQIAPHCDLMIVVGSRNSSNSMRLVEVALEAGAKRSERIDYPHEIRDEWLDGVSTIGLTSGASVPDELVQGALALLRERGFPKADEERLIEENLTFALPPELRRDLGGEDQRRSRRHPGRRGDEAAKKHEPLDVGAD